jgi:hypothetical protein
MWIALAFLLGSVVAEEYSFTPCRRVHRECVHPLDQGWTVQFEEGTYQIKDSAGFVNKSLPSCPFPPHSHGRAWKAWTEHHNDQGFTHLAATWTVPPLPFAPSATILYFWPGSEPEDNSFVLQPVVSCSSQVSLTSHTTATVRINTSRGRFLLGNGKV